jgi:signal transduction histidine kinase
VVSRAAPALNRLDFRRDVRLFLSIVVAFLAFLIILLLILLQSYGGQIDEAVRRDWTNIARTAVDIVNETAARDPGSLEATLSLLQSRYGVAGIVLQRANAQPLSVGVTPDADNIEIVTAAVHGGTMLLVFDASRLRTTENVSRAIAAICLAATAIVAVLLALYVPKITRPIEHMLTMASEIEERPDHPHDEPQYLIETFRRSIETLKAQEAELRRMHSVQKDRADDLERVTAALTRSLSSGFMALDPAGRVVEMNQAAREIVTPSAPPNGLSVEDAFGTNAYTHAIRDAVTGKLALSRVELAFADRGESRVIGLTTAPLVAADQQFLGLLALFTDLSGVRSLETRVRDLQILADVGEIAAGIAHEFRNSLATILGYLRLARRDAVAPLLSHVEQAEREATLLSKAVDGLLTFARPMQLARVTVSLRDLLDPLIESLAHASGVRIEAELEPVTIAGDASLLSRAFENLLRNAVESVELKGSGQVFVTLTDSIPARLEIRDEGVGLDPADVSRLLLPFQSQKPNGYGMGLPLARKIVLLHGGTLELTGAPGDGAVVRVTFAPPQAAVQFVPLSE